jgi:hypothetical protein
MTGGPHPHPNGYHPDRWRWSAVVAAPPSYWVMLENHWIVSCPVMAWSEPAKEL